MKLEDFKKESNGYYLFCRDDEIEERGYAICFDEICTIDLEELRLYRDCTLGKEEDIDITFNSEDELLDYVIEGKSIRQRIDELEYVGFYHIGLVQIDSKGNLTGEYEPRDCGNIKAYINRK